MTSAEKKFNWIKEQAASGRKILVHRPSFGAINTTRVKPQHIADAFKISGEMLLMRAGRSKWLSIDNAELGSVA